MLDGLGFIAYALVIGLWVFVWGVLGAIVANGRGQTFLAGFIQGALLGPVGVVLMPLLAMHRDEARAKDLPPTWASPSDRAITKSARDLYG